MYGILLKLRKMEVIVKLYFILGFRSSTCITKNVVVPQRPG